MANLKKLSLEEIEELHPGKELDLLVAAAIGWQVQDDQPAFSLPAFSADVGAAWLALERMNHSESENAYQRWVYIHNYLEGGTLWAMLAKDVALRICHAVLIASQKVQDPCAMQGHEVMRHRLGHVVCTRCGEDLGEISAALWYIFARGASTVTVSRQE